MSTDDYHHYITVLEYAATCEGHQIEVRLVVAKDETEARKLHLEKFGYDERSAEYYQHWIWVFKSEDALNDASNMIHQIFSTKIIECLKDTIKNGAQGDFFFRLDYNYS